MPYGVFEAADGPLVITVGNNGQFQRFCTDVIAKPEWAADERFATNTARSANRDLLMPLVQAELLRFTRAQLLECLTAAQIPCGEVLGLFEALNSQRTADAGLLHRFEDSEAGSQSVLARPMRWTASACPCAARRRTRANTPTRCCSSAWAWTNRPAPLRAKTSSESAQTFPPRPLHGSHFHPFPLEETYDFHPFQASRRQILSAACATAIATLAPPHGPRASGPTS